MSAYMIVTIEEMIDPDAMRHYAANVDGVVKQFDGVFLVPRGTTRVIEGSWDPGVVALIEFPSAKRVLDFYESPEYRPLRDLRHRAAKTSIVITEG
ncbi:DUF1330 domain-containing protein [Kibdelosporangium persicum]|uniref:D-fructose-6-phosphate amidotransferase n=1 Tax=Kibdelosporangium persicum TaxID=2698649 RepID=A0ABX2FDB7_9PSEU|nr:DUF1330 domain-containing protein [Kibdelosporangium persicum]NRN68760.1 D-fructose-6-phosphate amidotransferase [Kibdelosporangium persicum]